MEITALPCPFCGWENIHACEDKQRKGILKGSKYSYCFCKLCGARGPWAYTIGCSDDVTYREAIERWNERQGKKQDAK